MDKRRIRDYLRLASAFICIPIYLLHILFLFVGAKEKRVNIYADLEATKTDTLNLSGWIGILYLLHNDRWFRSLFYYRIGPIASLLIRWIRPEDKSFIISFETKIGPGVCIAHPYATILNAESIGSNFSCIHLTTLGRTERGRPIIGDNVRLGANVTIIGPVKIGNNVIVGAGAVVVKDIPDNSVVAGNPAKIIKSLDPVHYSRSLFTCDNS